MSGAVSVGAAAIAIGTAVGVTAEVGLTVGSALAITAAVGATVGAVGALTRVKELQYAGAALGAVSLVGGLAGAAGLFDTGASLFGAAGGEFGGIGGEASGFMGGGAGGFMGGAEGGAFMGGAPSAATDAGTWAGVELAGTGGPAPGTAEAAPKFDAVTMANGQTGVPPSISPDVTPSVTPTAATDVAPAPESQGLPAFESPTKDFNLGTAPGETPAPAATQPTAPEINVTGQVPDATPKGLLNGSVSSPADQPAAIDENGRLVGLAPQGEGPSQLGPGVGPNPQVQPSGPGFNEPPKVTGTTATPAPTNTPINPLDAGVAGSADIAAKAAAAGGPAKLPSLGDPSIWASIGDFVKNNQALSYGAIQAAGSFLSGSLSPLPQAQVEELEARKKQNEAAASLYNQQAALLQKRLANMSAPMPIASRSLLNGGGTVTGRPA